MEIQVTMLEDYDRVRVGILTVNTHFWGFVLMPYVRPIRAGSCSGLPIGRYKVYFAGKPEAKEYDKAYDFPGFRGQIKVSSFTRNLHGLLWSGSRKQSPTCQILVVANHPNDKTIEGFEKGELDIYERSSTCYRILYNYIKADIDKNEVVELVVNDLSKLIHNHILDPDIAIGEEHQGKLKLENK